MTPPLRWNTFYILLLNPVSLTAIRVPRYWVLISTSYQVPTYEWGWRVDEWYTQSIAHLLMCAYSLDLCCIYPITGNQVWFNDIQTCPLPRVLAPCEPRTKFPSHEAQHNSKTMPHEKFAFLKTSGDKQVNPSDSYCSATIIKQLVSNYQKGRKKNNWKRESDKKFEILTACNYITENISCFSGAQNVLAVFFVLIMA